jgi:histidine triad (HIT) family protein
VPHAHIHLIPINKEPDMNFHSPRIVLSKEELIEITIQIKKA